MNNIQKKIVTTVTNNITNINNENKKTILNEIQNVLKNNSNEKIKIINKGTGAGGSNTNYHGKMFENKTNNEQRLLNQGFVKEFLKGKNKYYLCNKYQDKHVVFIIQSNFKTYMKNKYNINLFRFPDEAYIIEFINGKKMVIVIEKKEQNVEGSVETKLWSGPSLKREYELVLGKDFEVHYCFCLNEFFKNKFSSNKKKYNNLKIILKENNIHILYGDDDDYFKQLNLWLYSLMLNVKINNF